MTEKPLERLNYYNGQRLEASDFRLEQEYHIRVRRWLNKSLYSAGIARGLEVRAVNGKPAVRVSPGLALDDDGHEIILWQEEEVIVLGGGRHHGESTSKAEVEGPYLTIRYDETVTAEESEGCVAPPGRGRANGNQPAWGGPARVLAKPLFAWRAFLPPESSGETVLAQVELTGDCKEVYQVNTGVRRYVGAASASKVRQYALEGCRDLENHNPQRIYFHVRGRQPNAVTLYLKAEKLSTLYYTEMGHHNHSLDIQLKGADGQHRHDLGKHTTAEEPAHSHSIADEFITLEQPDTGDFAATILKIFFPIVGAFVSYSRTVNFNRIAISPQYHFEWKIANQPVGSGDVPPTVTNDANLTSGPFEVAAAGKHSHKYGSDGGVVELTKDADANSAHTHVFKSTAAAPAGVTDPSPPLPAYQAYSAHTGAPLTYCERLEVWIGKDNNILGDHTGNILGQLADAVPSDWGGIKTLGDGTSNHVLVIKGTGPIRLDFLPKIAFTEGEYFIEFRVPAKANGSPNGGRVLYNLYVE